jgi:phosphohistidine swiveling domain-containing protein
MEEMTIDTAESADFPVVWDDPADAQLTWRFDPMHNPGAVTPLGFDLYLGPFVSGFGMLRATYQNYYAFYHQRPGGPPSPPSITPDSVRAGARAWREVVLPEVRGYDEYYRLTDFDAMPSSELVEELDRLVNTRVRCGQLHTMSTGPWWLGMTLLIDTCHELTGGDDLAALRLVQGHGNKSVEAGTGLWRLARLAGSAPAVRSRLGDSVAGKECLAALESEPEARPFLDDLAAFLDEFGWRSGLFEFAAPTWLEDPSVPLDQLRAYLQMPEYDPEREHERLASEREKALRDAMAPLDAEGRTRLREAVNAATEVVSILEDHNYYIDQRVGVLPRRLVLAAGRRLSSQGLIEAPEEVFYLRRAELRSALNGEEPAVAELVARHRAGMQRWSQVTPPEYIGAPPPPPAAADGASDRFWGARGLRSDRPGELKGSAASAGVARGPARVLQSLEEAGRLKPGDVLVTRTTMPPWTPLFAVACAVVAETGGVLSHAAVTAREYGLPAVLSVEGATRLIRDGQPLEVDGSNGTVRILS